MNTITPKSSLLLVLGGLVVVLGGLYFFLAPKHSSVSVEYNPKINPTDFTTNITNKYFSLAPGLKMVYEGGGERDEITVTGAKKTIMGVETLVYHDIVWLNGVLKEDTLDYVAQDKAGNVWYFGEDVSNYNTNGTLKDHAGGWIAGVNGAKPGIWMEANPKVGDKYRQEYYKGEAEDLGEVVSLHEMVTVPAGTYRNCIKTLDTSAIEPLLKEYKYYCAEVRGLVLEMDAVSGERTELTEFIKK